MDVMARGNPEAAGALLEGLDGLVKRLHRDQIVELLKHPVCVGQPRAVLVRQISREAKRPLTNVWDVADWLEQQQAPPDLSSPPLMPDF
jgi:hypothetical protein